MYNFIAKLLNFIESSTDQSNSDIIIAEYILRNTYELPNKSIYEVADACHTSPATITRFCKRFDDISFKELKEYARTFIEFNHTELNLDKMKDNFYPERLNEYFNDLTNSLEQTKELLKSKNLMGVIKRIYEAEKLAFFGVTFSHLLARNAQFKFIRLGKYVTAYSNHENQITDALSLRKGDFALIISFSGDTRFIVRLVKVLKGQGIPIVAITGREDSYLARNAEEIILVSDKSDSDFKSPIIEEISMLSIINSIYLVYSLFLHSIEEHRMEE